MKIMNKPLSMVIKDTKIKLANICNESSLSPIILELIVKDIYSEIRHLAEMQALEEKFAYTKSLESKDDDNKD